MIEVIDNLRPLLLAAAQTIKPETVGDDSLADPIAWAAGTLYVFEDDAGDTHAPQGDGSIDLEIFQLRAVYIADGTGEEHMGPRIREVSLELDRVKEAMLGAVRANRVLDILDDAGATVQLWADLRGAADMGFIRAISQRGVSVLVSGYAFIPGLN